MKYRAFYSDGRMPRHDITIEAADHRTAAQQLFSQHPVSTDRRINVETQGGDYSIQQFHASEFMDEATRTVFEQRRADLAAGASVDLTASYDPAHLARLAAGRYRDGYLVARAMNGLGGAVKAIGIGIGVIVALISLAIGSTTNMMFGFAGFLFGAAIAVPVAVLGILVSAQSSNHEGHDGYSGAHFSLYRY